MSFHELSRKYRMLVFHIVQRHALVFRPLLAQFGLTWAVPLAVGLLCLFGATAAGAADAMRLGVLAFSGKADTLQRWQPTAHALEQALPGLKLEVVPLSYDELNAAIEKRQIQFVLTNPEHYVVLNSLQGVHALATMNAGRARLDGRHPHPGGRAQQARGRRRLVFVGRLPAGGRYPEERRREPARG